MRPGSLALSNVDAAIPAKGKWELLQSDFPTECMQSAPLKKCFISSKEFPLSYYRTPKMALDVKERRFLSFIFWRLGPILAAFFGGATYLDLWKQPFRLLGVTTFAIQSVLWGVWAVKKFKMTFLSKELLSYGKWAIVTGATAGIGESFGFELAAK